MPENVVGESVAVEVFISQRPAPAHARSMVAETHGDETEPVRTAPFVDHALELMRVLAD